MKKGKIVFFIVLLLVFSLAIGLKLYGVRMLEYAVEQYSGYTLSIKGRADFRIVEKRLLIDADNITLTNQSSVEPLLEIGKLEVRLDIASLFVELVELEALRIENVKATIVRYDDGRYNWLPENLNSPDERGEFDWDIAVGELTVKNTKIQLQGFTRYQPRLLAARPVPVDSSQTLIIKELNLSGNRRDREIITTGELNQHAFELNAQLQNLTDYILDGMPLKFSGSSYFGGLKVSGKGVLGEVGEKTDVEFVIETDSLANLSSMVAYQLPDLGKIHIQGHLLGIEDLYRLDNLSISSKTSALALSLSGSIVKNLKGVEADVALRLASDDLGKVDMGQLELLGKPELLDGLRLDWNTQINYKPTQLTLNTVALLLANQTHYAAITGDAINMSLDDWPVFVATGKALQLDYQFSNNEGHWDYRYDSNNIKAGWDPEVGAQLDTDGRYKGMPFQAGGNWNKNGEYQLDAILDGMSTKLHGALRDNRFTIAANIKTKSLSPLSKLIDEDEVAVDRAELDIAVAVDTRGKTNTAELTNLNLLLLKDSNRLAIKGQAVDLLNFDDYQLQVKSSADSLEKLQNWVVTASPAVEASLHAFADFHHFASESSITGLQSKPAPNPWLQSIMQSLALEDKLRDYPDLDGRTVLDLLIKGKDKKLYLDINTIDIHSPTVQITVQGKHDPVSATYDGDVKINLKPNVSLKLLAGATLSSHVNYRDDDPIRLSKLKFTVGKSYGTANLLVTLDKGPPKLTGTINLSRLDLSPYFPKRTSAQPSSNDKTFSSSTAIFSDEVFPLKKIPDFDIDLEMKSAKLSTPWVEFSRARWQLKNSTTGFSLNSFSGAIGAAPVVGSFSISAKKAKPIAKLTMRIDNLDPNKISFLDEDEQFFKQGTVNLLVDVNAEGNSSKAMAETLTGRLSAVSHFAVLNKDDLNEIAPDILSSINKRLNPFAKKSTGETKLECSVVHFEAHNGLMDANKSIVFVTPEILFGLHGVIDLGHEQLRMQVIPKTRTGLGFSIKGSFAKMAVINGPFNDLKVKFDPTSSLISSGLDITGTVLYGPAYWLYMGQAQKLLATAQVCERLVNKLVPEFSLK